MIPTLLLVGLVLGRWWRVVVPVAVVGWASLVVVDGDVDTFGGAAAAAGVALLNVVAGVVVNRGVAVTWADLRSRIRSRSAPRR